jgi:hypothetical protein
MSTRNLIRMISQLNVVEFPTHQGH